MEETKDLLRDAVKALERADADYGQLSERLDRTASSEDLDKARRKGVTRDVGLLVAVLIALAAGIVALIAVALAHDGNTKLKGDESCIATTLQASLTRNQVLGRLNAQRTAADRQVRRWDTARDQIFNQIVNSHRAATAAERHAFAIVNAHKLRAEAAWKHWDDLYQAADAAHPVPQLRLCAQLARRLPVRTVTTTAQAAPAPTVTLSPPTVTAPAPAPVVVRVSAPAPPPVTRTVIRTVTTTAPPGKATATMQPSCTVAISSLCLSLPVIALPSP